MPPRAGRKPAPEALTTPREHRPRASKTAAPTASEQLKPPELSTIDEDTASPAAPSMAAVHDVAEGSLVGVESVVETAEESIVPVESAVEEAGAIALEEGELPAPNSIQSSPAAPADGAAAELTTSTTTPSDDQGESSCLRLLVTQQQQQITQLLQQSNHGQQRTNQLVAQRQADKQQQDLLSQLSQQQATEIQLLKREVERLRDDVGKRSSHVEQAASLQRANTQLAALDHDVKQLQKQQPKPAKQTVAENPTATPGQQARRGSSGMAEDAHGGVVL